MSEDVPFEIQVEIIRRLPVKSLLQFRSVSKQWKSLIHSSKFIVGYKARQKSYHRIQPPSRIKMSEDVPFEIQVEIIRRLPVKSLLQFRSVSKRWKSLIHSSKFIVGYKARQIQPQRLLVGYIDPVSFEDKFVSFLDDETFAVQELNSTVPVLAKQLRHSQFIGSSQGLVCLFDRLLGSPYYKSARSSGMAVLWNPSIRKSVGISVQRFFIENIVVGFGVCPTTNDPTIVKFTKPSAQKRTDFEMINGTETDIYVPWAVEVFSLSVGGWRIPCGKPPNVKIAVHGIQVVIDKFIYWHCLYVGALKKNLIMTYDMITEEIGEIQLPDALAHQPCDNISICKVGESLAILEYSTNTNKQVCVVLLMDGSAPSLFTKLFTINTPYTNIRTQPLGFTKSGEPILSIQGDDETDEETDDQTQDALVVYEPCSEYTKEIGIYGVSYSFFVDSYLETLLLHDQMDSKIYSNTN